MLVVISGIDGCGKSLQVSMLKRRLEDDGKNVVIVKAYDDTAKIACRPFMETWTDDMAITFLFQALHAQQYSVAAAALREGSTVIADRWDESYLAYHQNFGYLSEFHDIRQQLNQMAFRGQLPDFGFILKVPPEVAYKRRVARGAQERFEGRSNDYHATVQKSYCDIAAERGWAILDGTQTPETIHGEILRIIYE
ncbi:dTMP kinase [Patescibacteria group bacterium]|nr:dTMP kinase [Patescibacteria group bacterium]